ncbi:MAG TPA: head-tail connector protein [Sphingomonas sp.]
MSAPDGALADAKAYLRIDGTDEDALLDTLIGAALDLCERFTGLALFASARTAMLEAVTRCWQRLPATPVTAISGVSGVDATGVATALPVEDYAIDIDAAGDGWVRLTAGIAQHRIAIAYQAGLAADWPSLPEPLRQGALRLVAHLHAHRDAGDDAGPPAAVAALWRPFRRMRLS